MTVWYDNQVQMFDLLKVDDLPFPVLLGQDAPGFAALVQKAMQEVAEEDVATDKETPEHEHSDGPIPSTWVLDPQFLQAQKTMTP